jgi:hypothetical protein
MWHRCHKTLINRYCQNASSGNIFWEENAQLKIWVNKFSHSHSTSHVPDRLMGMQGFSQLKDRVDFFHEPDKGVSVANYYEGVLAGSHVLICAEETLDTMMSEIFKDAGRCASARVDDFRQD